MQNIDVSIIVPVYNGLPFFKACLRQLKKNIDGLQAEIIIIDGGSNPETLAWIDSKTVEGKIILFSNPTRLSTAEAYNKGIRFARGYKILFIHSDTILPTMTIKHLLTAMADHPEYDSIAPVQNKSWYQQLKIEGGVPAYNNFAELDVVAENLYLQRQHNILTTFVLENSCMMVTKQAVDKTGDWDICFAEHYFEDVDYTYRMQRLGFKLGVANAVYVHHEGHVTYSSMQMEPYERLCRYRAVFKNKWGFDFGYGCTTRFDMLKHIDLKHPGSAILDIGCSLGANLVFLKNIDATCEVCGVELDEHTACIAQNFADVRAADVETIDIPEWQGKFDYIIMGDLIEHLVNPWEALRKIKKMLRPDGQILASIPNILNIDTMMYLLSGRFHYTDNGVLDRTHMRFFTKQEMLDLFAIAGYNAEVVGANPVINTDPEMNNLYDRLTKELSGLQSVQVDVEQLGTLQYIIRGKIV